MNIATWQILNLLQKICRYNICRESLGAVRNLSCYFWCRLISLAVYQPRIHQIGGRHDSNRGHGRVGNRLTDEQLCSCAWSEG